MKNFFRKLSPTQRRNLVIGGAAAIIIGALIFATSGDSERIQRKSKNQDVRAVLTSRDSRNIGMESLAAKQKNLERRNSELERQIELMKRESTGSNGVFESVEELSKKMSTLQRELHDVARGQEKLKDKVTKTSRKQNTSSKKASADSVTKTDVEREIERQLKEKNNNNVETVEGIFGHKPSKNYTPDDDDEDRGRAGASEAVIKETVIRTIRAQEPEPEDDDADADDSLYLPIGSIITGTLINGMDAPTGQGARRDPFPATLRIQKEAILPNHFSLDVRECFLQVSGYGDMSSERAYLRGEAISCVRNDGGIIEASLDSYVVGEDGKAGARGRLVSKEGQLLARSLMAGFLEGVSGAFNVKEAPALRISSGGSDDIPILKQSFDSDRMAGGFAKGTGNALGRLADYYMDMADSIFPVIEIDAGRQLDVVVTKGTSLKIKSK